MFSVMVLLVLAALELYVENLPNPARDKHRWMQGHSEEVGTLVLGSSHTFYGIMPEILGSDAFSMAQVSQTYRYDLWALKNYPMKNLHTVIIPFSYFSLYEDYELGVGDDYASRYRIYMDCDVHSRFSKYSFELSDFDMFKEKVSSLWRPGVLSWTERGFASNYTLEARPENWDNGKVRAERNTYEDLSAVELNTRFLKEMLQYCREKNIRLLIVSTPLTASFREHRDPLQVERNMQTLGALLEMYSEADYLDFESDERFSDEDFFDADHLSTLGAEKLSRLIREALRS